MKVVDIATEIFIDAGSPSDTSIPAIAYWLRTKVGSLNTLVYEDLYINEAQEIFNAKDGSEISPELVSLLKQMYKVYDLEVQVRSFRNALAADAVLQVTDNLGGTSFKRVNRNEVMKTLVALRKDELTWLSKMIDSYRSLTSAPSQVAGDDTVSGYSEPYPAYRPYWTRISTYGRW
jgi:hypothetical protein